MHQFFFIVILFISTFSFAGQDTLYFNKEWKKCSKRKATYYRVAEPQAAGGYLIKDMHIKTNIPQMVAFSTKIHPLYKEGKCTFYYSDGMKESEGYYSKNVTIGIWKSWSKDGKDSTFQDFSKIDTKKIAFVPQELSNRQRIQDSIIKYNSYHGLLTRWDSTAVYDEEEKPGFSIALRGKFATFFIIEDAFFLTYTLGTEFIYNRHSLGLDYTWFRWRYERDDTRSEEPMYNEYELRKYWLLDYKYAFLKFTDRDMNLYINAYDKIGKYSMWYHKEDYPFGTKDMTFLESKINGTFNEPALGLGWNIMNEGFGIDCSANVGYRMSNDNLRTHISATEKDFRDGVKTEKVVFYIRVNLFFNLMKGV